MNKINKKIAKEYAKKIDLKMIYTKQSVIDNELLPNVNHSDTLIRRTRENGLEVSFVKGEKGTKGNQWFFRGEDLVKHIYEYYNL